MEVKDDMQLSTSTKLLLAKYQDRVVQSDQKRVDTLRGMSLVEFLARGISVESAPFELAGRMLRKGWASLSYDKNKPGWQVYTHNYHSTQYVTKEAVQDMLESEE